MATAPRLSISADGQFVAFHSSSGELVSTPADTDGDVDVFLRDRPQQATEMISVTSAGLASGTGAARVPVVSGDGNTVIFESAATDLVAGVADDNNGFDVFARDVAGGVTSLASINAAGTGAGNRSSAPIDVSDDGHIVLFSSLATDLVPGFVEGNLSGQADLFARDLVDGVTYWVTSDPAGAQGANRSVIGDAISADGRFVLFETAANNLVGSIDGNDGVDVFLRDLAGGTTILVSVNAAGTASAAGASRNARMSADGRFVSFTSTATDLVPDFVDGNREEEEDLYLRDMTTGETSLVSVNAAGTASGNMGTLNFRVPYGLSRDGRFIAFSSAATDLVTGVADGNRTDDVFVRDLDPGVTTCVSTAPGGTPTGNTAALAPQVADSGTVIFRSTSNNLVPGSGSKLNLFIRSTPGAPTALVTNHAVAATGADADTGAYVLSDDGRFVAFASPATNLIVGDTNGTEDVFLYDVLAAPVATPTPTATITSTRPTSTATATLPPPTETATVPPGSTATATEPPPTETSTVPPGSTATATEPPPTETATVPPDSTATATEPPATETATVPPDSTATATEPPATETATVPPGSTATATEPPATETATVPPGSTATATEPPESTPTPSRTVPPGSTATSSPTPTASDVATATPTATPSPTGELPIGDCDGNGRVTVDDLIKGVNIALDAADPSTCPSLDVDGSGTVTVNELVRAVANALEA